MLVHSTIESPHEHICLYCGKKFYFRLAKPPVNNPGKYCSKACANRGKVKGSEKVCPQCGKSFICPPNVQRKHCSPSCTRAARPRVNCVVCGKKYFIRPSQVETTRYCSKPCADTAKRTNQRKGPISIENRLGTKAWVRLRNEIVERDGRRCTRCGMAKKVLCVHHVVAWRVTHDDSPSNLTTLCRSCHAIVEPR